MPYGSWDIIIRIYQLMFREKVIRYEVIFNIPSLKIFNVFVISNSELVHVAVQVHVKKGDC